MVSLSSLSQQHPARLFLSLRLLLACLNPPQSAIFYIALLHLLGHGVEGMRAFAFNSSVFPKPCFQACMTHETRVFFFFFFSSKGKGIYATMAVYVCVCVCGTYALYFGALSYADTEECNRCPFFLFFSHSLVLCRIPAIPYHEDLLD